jgi:RHS repeat-associated protein
VGKKVNGTLVAGLLYQDGLNPIAALDAAGAVTARFVYATRAHVPDLMITGGTNYRIVSDHLGSPRLVVDTTTGEIAQRLDYDPFGRITADTNPGFQPFGFAGGLYDPQTGLVRFGARDYEPEVGRWTAMDPILFDGREANLFSYSFGDPVNLLDPTGLDAVTSDPMVREYFFDLWRQAGYGKRETERAAWITKDPQTGQFGCAKWPWTADYRSETWGGPLPQGTVALAHTHPDTTSPKPSTSGDKSDAIAARDTNHPVYTITRGGIWKIEPNGTITMEVGPDWKKGIDPKRCTPCA